MLNRVFSGLMAFVALSSLTACDGAEREAFVADCVAADTSSSVCECYYEFGTDGLSEEQMELYTAIIAQDQSRISKAQSDLGMFGTVGATARITWVARQAADACEQ